MYTGGTLDEAVAAVKKYMDENVFESKHFIMEKDNEKAKEVEARALGIVRGHFVLFSEGRIQFMGIAAKELVKEAQVNVEKRRDLILDDGTKVHFHGYIDLWYPSLGLLIDHKTTSRMKGQFVDAYLVSTQLYIYAFLMGNEEGGVKQGEYNMIGKPQHKKHQKDIGFDPLADRLMAAIVEKPMDYWRTLLVPDVNNQTKIQEAASIAVALKNDPLIYPNRGACMDYGGCDYLPICAAGGMTSELSLLYREKDPWRKG
jgi:hypothetical protein